MSEKDEIIEKLKALKPELKEKFGIEEFAIFGSFARDEASEKSDIDIVILKINNKNGLIIARAKRFMCEVLKRDIDLGLYDSLRPFIRRRIKNQLIYV